MKRIRYFTDVIILIGILFTMTVCEPPVPPYGRLKVSFDLSKRMKDEVDDFTQVVSGMIFLKQGNNVMYETEVEIVDHVPQDCTLTNIRYGEYEIIAEFYKSDGFIAYSAEGNVIVNQPENGPVTLTLEKYIGTLVISGSWEEDIPNLETASAVLKKDGNREYGMSLALDTTEKTVSGVRSAIYPGEYVLIIKIRDTSDTVMFSGKKKLTIEKGTNEAVINLLAKVGDIEIHINGDVTAPVITNGPNVIVNNQYVTITWTTDEPATSLVCYSEIEGFDYQSQITWAPEGGDLDADTTNHSVVIYGLPDGNTYYFVIVTADKCGNKRVSDEGNFLVGQIIPLNLRQTESSIDSYTIEWDAYPEASEYAIYKKCPSGVILYDTIEETTYTRSNLGRFGYWVDTGNYDSECIKVVPVVNGSEVIETFYYIYPVLYDNSELITADFYDDFSDGIIDPKYRFINFNVNSQTQIYEQNNRMETYIKVTDNPGLVYFICKMGANQKIRISVKLYIHRANNYHGGTLRYYFPMYTIPDKTINFEMVGLVHDVYNNIFGFNYFPQGSDNDAMKNISTTEKYDQWFDMIIELDKVSNTCTISYDTETEIFIADNSYKTMDIILFSLENWGWYTGHYMYIDDLSVDFE